ncbi:uncharacterized protein K452DRAFT_329023 [Aplosporella prunicola CBS 121167]|uniref:Uncharacterized protein n=1 Tax=Aplosporella prunicola CBS 121167 TaxID=1176127 RepID=A0A6A6B575_9PEZI|nr:uncharacterized protein K452DRAFT_329023 [Aplosporella prunicola CBS 121167]KAF2138127.1 hypothetical protein K452DRAFT_329023 [Aplosporella prunicola CBS 121167]
MGTEVSQQVKASLHPVASPDGAYVAALNGSRLQVRAAASLTLVRSIPLPAEYTLKTLPALRWSPISSADRQTRRILLADDSNVRVWDLHDAQWTALINNGSGGMGKVVNAEFGNSADEALVFSDFGARVTAWSLTTGRSVEIRDPKFYKDARGIGFGPGNGIFALLSRPAAQDMITLHARVTFSLLKTVILASSDAQGFKWSPDGRWFVVWDAPSTGYRLYVYTADGHLYRTYSGDEDVEVRGLGIKSIEWSSRGDFLAVGGFDERVTLLSTRTFSPTVFLDHTSVVQLSAGEVWQEQISATSGHSYTRVPQPVSPPLAPQAANEPVPKSGISVVAFNADGSLIATRDDSMPTSVWLWDLSRLAARTVLIQHSPVKSLQWHPSIPNLVLIHCAQEEPIVYFWDASTNEPRAVHIPLEKAAPRTSSKLEARWLADGSERKPSLIFSDVHGFLTVWPEGKETILRFDGSRGSRPGTPGSTNESEDSLYNILTGRTPVPGQEDTTSYDVDDSGDSVMLEDTFHGKGRHLQGSLRDSECF